MILRITKSKKGFVAFEAIIIIFLISLWNLYSLRLNENIRAEEVELLSFQITDILAKFEGSPPYWQNDPENTSTLGLNDGTGKLDEKKVNAFLQMNYTSVKRLLNIERFEYYMEVRDDNGNLLNSSGMNATTAEHKVSIVRLSLIGNSTRQLRFTLWD